MAWPGLRHNFPMKALRILLLLLLLANLAVLFWNRGLFGSDDDGREPERLEEQKAADKLKIVPPAAALPSLSATATAPMPAPVPAPATVPTPTPTPPAAPAPAALCRLVSGLPAAENKTWITAAAAKLPEARIAPSAAAPSYDVLIPALAGKDAAESKLKEVRALGVTAPVRTVADGGDKFALVFASLPGEAAAKAQLQALQEKGVRSARIVARPPGPPRIEVSHLDEAGLKILKDLLAARADLHLDECPAP